MGKIELTSKARWDMNEFDEPIYAALVLAIGPPPKQEFTTQLPTAIIDWDNNATEWLDEAGHSNRRWGLSQACIVWWQEKCWDEGNYDDS